MFCVCVEILKVETLNQRYTETLQFWIRGYYPVNEAVLLLSKPTFTDWSISQSTDWSLPCWHLFLWHFDQTVNKDGGFPYIGFIVLLCHLKRERDELINLLSAKPYTLLGLIKKKKRIHGLPRTPLTCKDSVQRDSAVWYRGIWCHNLKDSYCTVKGSW